MGRDCLPWSLLGGQGQRCQGIVGQWAWAGGQAVMEPRTLGTGGLLFPLGPRVPGDLLQARAKDRASRVRPRSDQPAEVGMSTWSGQSQAHPSRAPQLLLRPGSLEGCSAWVGQ